MMKNVSIVTYGGTWMNQ